MASGKAWSGALPANINQDTGATPSGKVRTASINMVNYGATSAALSSIHINKCFASEW